MINGLNIKCIDDEEIGNKRVLVRVDYNVSFNSQHKIADDLRIKQSLPTLKLLLDQGNKIILVSHLGQPKDWDKSYSLAPVVTDLKKLLQNVQVSLVDDFLNDKSKLYFDQQKPGEIIMLENIRFYPQEKQNDIDFAKQLAQLANIYVNDAFGVSHRKDASIVSIPKFIPSFAGLLLKREVETLLSIFHNPEKPFVALIGGAKISTKINFLTSLIDKVNVVMIGGGLANTFLYAKGKHVGASLIEKDEAAKAREIIEYAKRREVLFLLPTDVVVEQNRIDKNTVSVKSIDEIIEGESIVDIGPKSQAIFGKYIAGAKTILWNGPFGCIENPKFLHGTEFLYHSIAQNKNALSIVGGGDTISAISSENYISEITWVSTGGGAMIEFVEKGTLPGIEVLKK